MFLSWVFYLAVFLRFSYVFWGRGELAGGPAFRFGLRGSESWSVLCTGGSAGAALCVEDVAVLRDEKNKQCCIIVVYCAVVLTVGSRMRGFYIFYSKYV